MGSGAHQLVEAYLAWKVGPCACKRGGDMRFFCAGLLPYARAAVDQPAWHQPAWHRPAQEADAAAAADPRGLGGLRADKIKSLSMTVPRDGHRGGARGGGSAAGSAPGWSQELVIDGG